MKMAAIESNEVATSTSPQTLSFRDVQLFELCTIHEDATFDGKDSPESDSSVQPEDCNSSSSSGGKPENIETDLDPTLPTNFKTCHDSHERPSLLNRRAHTASKKTAAQTILNRIVSTTVAPEKEDHRSTTDDPSLNSKYSGGSFYSSASENSLVSSNEVLGQKGSLSFSVPPQLGEDDSTCHTTDDNERNKQFSGAFSLRGDEIASDMSKHRSNLAESATLTIEKKHAFPIVTQSDPAQNSRSDFMTDDDLETSRHDSSATSGYDSESVTEPMEQLIPNETNAQQQQTNLNSTKLQRIPPSSPNVMENQALQKTPLRRENFSCTSTAISGWNSLGSESGHGEQNLLQVNAKHLSSSFGFSVTPSKTIVVSGRNLTEKELATLASRQGKLSASNETPVLSDDHSETKQAIKLNDLNCDNPMPAQSVKPLNDIISSTRKPFLSSLKQPMQDSPTSVASKDSFLLEFSSSPGRSSPETDKDQAKITSAAEKRSFHQLIPSVSPGIESTGSSFITDVSESDNTLTDADTQSGTSTLTLGWIPAALGMDRRAQAPAAANKEDLNSFVFKAVYKPHSNCSEDECASSREAILQMRSLVTSLTPACHSEESETGALFANSLPALPSKFSITRVSGLNAGETEQTERTFGQPSKTNSGWDSAGSDVKKGNNGALTPVRTINLHHPKSEVKANQLGFNNEVNASSDVKAHTVRNAHTKSKKAARCTRIEEIIPEIVTKADAEDVSTLCGSQSKNDQDEDLESGKAQEEGAAGIVSSEVSCTSMSWNANGNSKKQSMKNRLLTTTTTSSVTGGRQARHRQRGLLEWFLIFVICVSSLTLVVLIAVLLLHK